MDGIAKHFPAKNALDCRILHIQSQFFPGSNRPGAWIQTPISAAYFASVPIVPVLRNDHCSAPYKSAFETDIGVAILHYECTCDAAHCIPVLIQQNFDGSDFFNRSWAEFKVGFNDTRGNYWLGNDLISQLTLSGRYRLRFDLQLRNLSWYWAEYSRFTVLDESNNYKIQVHRIVCVFSVSGGIRQRHITPILRHKPHTAAAAALLRH